jgi:hypothetical protein
MRNSIVLTLLLCVIAAVQLSAQTPIPGLVTVEANTQVNPPAWAALERRLLDVMSTSALQYHARYTRSGGTLIWKTSGLASLDDLPESFYNFPLLYALGGDEKLRELSFRAWNSTVRQLTEDFPIYHRDFPKYGDWFHIGEGIIYFYFLPLADPTDHETFDRAKRFAGLYLNEDPLAQNYDPKLKIIRGGENGSLGPLLNYRDKGCPCILPPWYGSMPPEPYVRSLTEPPPYLWTREMAGYGLPLEDVPGITKPDDLKDPENARRMGVEVMKRIYPGDVPVNLGTTSLVLNAYLFTGEQKYADWIKEYTGAWLERTKANGGVTPDNVGLSGKVGENQNGKWWGGLYGWRWPHGYHSVGQAFHLSAANAMLVSKGEASYLELPRSNIDYLLALGKTTNGATTYPTQKNAEGWFKYQPMDRSYLVSLWYMSMDPRDWQRIEKVRKADTLDWRTVVDSHTKMDHGHDAPWLRYLAGENPDYPGKILASAHGQVTARMERIRNNILLLDTDPARWEKVDADKVDMTKVSEHHWQSVNPVTTEALVQLMLGAPQIQYNGGVLHASVRYFDPARQRPGIPQDVAALVTKIEADRTELELVNLSPTEIRDVIVQAGTFGEHQFTRVKYTRREELPSRKLVETSAEVNRKFLQVRLLPGVSVKLSLGVKRFANKPSYAFPWHGDTIPIR